MRWAAVVGGAVLVLAMALWWQLRGQAPAAVTATAAVAAAQEAGDNCAVLPEMGRHFAKLSEVGQLAAMRQLPDTPPP